MKQQILMCAPEHFRVGYAINPWMQGNVGQLDKARTRRQWENLKAELENVADVKLIAPEPDWPDMVFTANAGTVYKNKVALSRFYNDERSGEDEFFGRWFKEQGFEVLEFPEDIAFEGAGDSLFDRREPLLWAGYGFRTDLESHNMLREWFDVDVQSMHLTNPHFYHIDTCFCPLEGGHILYHPQAFDEASNKAIEKRYPKELRIAVHVRDAGQFGCNMVNVGEYVFANRLSTVLKNRLHEVGYKVVETPLGEFLLSGGSAKCLTLKLVEPVEKLF